MGLFYVKNISSSSTQELNFINQINKLRIYRINVIFTILAKMVHMESDGHVGSFGVLLMSLSSNGAPNFIKWMPERQRGELIVPQHFP